MNRKRFLEYCTRSYPTIITHPFEKDEKTIALCHDDTKNRYALLTKRSRRELGQDSDEIVDVVVLKRSFKELTEIYEMEAVHPAIYMNKKYWVSVVWADLPEDMIYVFTDMSYNGTRKKKRPLSNLEKWIVT